MAFLPYAISDVSSNYPFRRKLSGNFQRGRRNRDSHCAFSDELSGAAIDCKIRYSPVRCRQSFSVSSASRRGCVSDPWT